MKQPIIPKEGINERIEGLLAKLNAAQELHEACNGYQPGYKFDISTGGKRYIRITSQSGGSAYAFVDVTDGSLYKPASYKAPANKHARSNVFDEDFGFSACGPYGLTYLRGGGNYEWLTEPRKQ